jgi:hypothetical protein
MTWVAWRRQRTETLIAAAILAAIACLLVPTGLHIASAFDNDHLAACLGAHTSSSCGDTVNSFTVRFERLDNLIAWFTLVPGLVGVLLAAPFVLELEQGTYRLGWTQSVTRRRWIATKLGLAVGAALVGALALIALLTWWHAPLVRLNGRMDNTAFDSEGTVVIGYTLFALGVSAAVGVVWRRAVPALVIGFGAYFAARIFVDTWLRQRLIAPIHASWPMGTNGPENLRHAWVISQQGAKELARSDAPCLHVATKQSLETCLGHHGALVHAVYVPASRFWALQGIETGLFGGAALILLLFAAWWTHERL